MRQPKQERFPRRRFPGGGFRHDCHSCNYPYVWSEVSGNPICPRCLRKVPVEERPLLPAEERRARGLVEGER